MAGPSPGHPRHPAPAKKAWIIGTSPVMTTMSGADAVIYTRILGTRQPWAWLGHPRAAAHALPVSVDARPKAGQDDQTKGESSECV
jgi:hypothetical protein